MALAGQNDVRQVDRPLEAPTARRLKADSRYLVRLEVAQTAADGRVLLVSPDYRPFAIN